MTSYRIGYYVSWAVAVLEIALAAIGTIGPENAGLYGISPVAVRWAVLVAGILGLVATLLPRIQRKPDSYGMEPLPPDVRKLAIHQTVNRQRRINRPE